jgi:Predicted Zn-dependent protease
MPLYLGNGIDIILYIIAAALVLLAQAKVQSAYQKYREVETIKGMTGAEVAQTILLQNGVNDVTVQRATGGSLSDHYDPRNKTVNLSADIYQGRSIAAVAVAAHEVGHAIQHNVGYGFLTFRNMIAPLASISSTLSFPILFLGLFTRVDAFFTIGLILFMGAAVFQLITLPVEFNASARALKILDTQGFLVADEVNDAKKMLTAAALTYVAGLANSIIQIIRILGMRNRR